MNNYLSLSLFESIADSPIFDIGTDLGEVALDSVLEEGLLRDIPIVGSMVSIIKTGGHIRDRIFLKKVIKFLQVMSHISPEDKGRFSSFFRDQKERERFGETMILLLDKMTDMTKPELLGHLWAACSKGEISYEDALRISFMIDAVYWSDLTFLVGMTPGVQRENTPIAESLHRAGLVSLAGIDGGTVSDPLSSGMEYAVNRFGTALVIHALSKMR